MTFTIGQAIRVKTRQQDEDTGTSIAGWSGRVIAFHSETGMLEVEWDSPTLAQLPDAYIRHSIDGGYDYFRYHIEAINVEAIEPQDTPSQVKAVQKALEVHYDVAPILLSRKYSGRILAKALHEACVQDLKARTAIRPSPPLDWKRETPIRRQGVADR